MQVTGDLLHVPQEAQRVASALAFLYRLGLVPIVVHGAGLFSGKRAEEVENVVEISEKEANLPDAARERRLDASRVALEAAQTYMERANSSLCRALTDLGVEVEPFVSDAFHAELDETAVGFGEGIMGRVVGVEGDRIFEAIENGRVPVIAALSSADGAKPLTFSTWHATSWLAKVLKPLKVVVLRPEGGVLRADGSVMSRVSIERDFDQLFPPPLPAIVNDAIADDVSLPEHDPWLLDEYENTDDEGNMVFPPEVVDAALLHQDEDSDSFQPHELLIAQAMVKSIEAPVTIVPTDRRSKVISAGDEKLLLAIEELFEDGELEPGATVAVTSPQYLASELFRERGGGTMVVRGEKVR
jgi:acetylglutamate kinase